MNKTAIKNFSVWAREKLIGDIVYQAGLLGVTEAGAAEPLPQSTGDLQFFDIGTKEYAQVAGAQIKQRNDFVYAIKRKAQESDFKTAFQYVVEEVAYTWFNRLIAIRFMEVNDYLPSRIRVLSSENPAKNEPDFVTSPFDANLPLTEEEKSTVLKLKEQNHGDELFRLLFIKQCNALTAVLPELFERTEDYTELLLTISYTDPDGVVYHLVHDIDEQDFNISSVDEDGTPTGQVQIIGWLYQYYNSVPKDTVFANLKKNIKITKENIPAATQLFTPDWIVRYMVENSLGRLYVDKRKNEGVFADGRGPEEMTWEETEAKRIANEKYISQQMGWKYYLPEAEQTKEVRKQLDEIQTEQNYSDVAELKLIDPCMGSGHILVYAFDVLMQMYEAQGYTQRDAAQSIVQNNLFGLEIDKRAYQLAYFAVMMKARQYDRRFLERGIRPQLYYPGSYADGQEYGSLLIVDELEPEPEEKIYLIGEDSYETRMERWNFRRLLAQKYNVVVTNPPYMAVSNASGKMQDYVKQYFPNSKADLFAVFIERCGMLTKVNGYQAMITQHAWMFINSFEAMRGKILSKYNLISLVHLGIKAFEEIGNDVVQTVAFVISNRQCKDFSSSFVRLVDYKNYQEKQSEFFDKKNCFVSCCTRFFQIPGLIFAYWVSERFVLNFENKSRIEDYGVFTGSQNITGDNERFLRFHWEVEKKLIESRKWVFYAKGGDYRQYYGNLLLVIDWSDSARHYYATNKTSNLLSQNLWYREGITYSAVTSRGTGFRLLPSGCIFDKGGPSICVNHEKIPELLALLNSNVAKFYFWVFNPSINLQVKDIKSFPILLSDKALTIEKASECIELSKNDWDFFETSWDFKQHPLVPSTQEKLEQLKSQFATSRIDATVVPPFSR